MASLGVFYGSTDGNTERAATMLAQALRAVTGDELEIELLDIAEYFVEDMVDFDFLILGVPTWNHGQLQEDWEAVLEEFDGLDLSHVRAVIFGLGDQAGYPATFADAMFFLADRLRACGATLVGAWPCEGYTFSDSWAVEDGRFLGLVLDEVNQAELTAPRIQHWVQMVAVEFGLPPRGAA
jgi:flavodoxin I